jgi:hypothetical protein
MVKIFKVRIWHVSQDRLGGTLNVRAL